MVAYKANIYNFLTSKGIDWLEIISGMTNIFFPEKTSAQDYKTRFALQGCMFWGAYMTDIIKSYEEKISGNLMKYLSKNKDFEKENVKPLARKTRIQRSYKTIAY